MIQVITDDKNAKKFGTNPNVKDDKAFGKNQEEPSVERLGISNSKPIIHMDRDI